MTNCITFDDTAFLHNGLGRFKAALPVFKVDQRQDPGIGLGGLRRFAGQIVRDHRSNEFRQKCTRHGAGRTGFQIGHQCYRLLPIKGTLDRGTAGGDEVPQLCRRPWNLNLEIANLRYPARQISQKGDPFNW